MSLVLENTGNYKFNWKVEDFTCGSN